MAYAVARSATNPKKLTLTDFPERDDVQRMKHILSRLDAEHVENAKVVFEYQEHRPLTQRALNSLSASTFSRGRSLPWVVAGNSFLQSRASSNINRGWLRRRLRYTVMDARTTCGQNTPTSYAYHVASSAESLECPSSEYSIPSFLLQ